ncbi:tail fiber protein [Dinoroseobacter sp. PD6]|uniref:phage tail protein n=1 Tax=Dinoroseobacter sp. PD6 TaxID=3028384 RepID=UPI00237C1061|nr:tail fiber protein [Dinoroseobacter sp. PD6]MDD9716424.1 tail fiber protein [Dinoroseobacter sp. PD6]
MFNPLKSSLAACVLALATSVSAPAHAQEAYLGQIIMGGWNFCPRGTAPLNGQLIQISQNSALFSLLGTQFGGDGRTTFALPDMRGRVALHNGTGPGLTNKRIGARGGSETNTLTVDQLPPHAHALTGTSTAANTPSPAGALPATTGRDSSYAAGSADTGMGAGAIGSTGGGQPVNNMPPYTVVQMCIVTQGLFPSRS